MRSVFFDNHNKYTAPAVRALQNNPNVKAVHFANHNQHTIASVKVLQANSHVREIMFIVLPRDIRQTIEAMQFPHNPNLRFR